MPTVCRYRPNRSAPRLFTRNDAARVLCYAYAHDSSTSQDVTGPALGIQVAKTTFTQFAQQVVGIAEVRCGDRIEKRFDVDQAQIAEIAKNEDATLSGLLGDYAANIALFQQLLEWFGALITFLTVLIGIARIVPFPQIRLVATGAGRILTRVTAFQGAIIARKAANDSAMNNIRILQEINKAIRKAA